MKIKTTFLILLFIAFSVNADTNTLAVPGRANIWGAGHSGVPEGDLPVGITFTPGPGQVLSFLSVTGQVTFRGGSDPAGPDDYVLGYTFSLPSANGISGLTDNHGGYMVGVFLDDSEPQDPAPGALDFTQIGHGFSSLAPQLRQVFFIGDGRSGTGSGGTQQFVVPPTATRLYLGTPDSFYGDNVGEFHATSVIVTGTTLAVAGSANIWGAGHSGVPEGDLPVGITFTPGPGQVLRFPSVTGQVNFGDGRGPVGPDDIVLGYTFSLPSANGISGLTDNHGGYMVGVFLDDSEPQDPTPGALDFTQIGHGFSSLAPQLRQVFFIGDGLSGTGSGGTQQFVVPPTATRLYLGTPDSFYGDNVGEFHATFAIATAIQPPPAIISFGFTNQAFQLEVSALAGQSYVLQANTSLSVSNWISLSTNEPVASPLYLSDTTATNFPSRLYRIARE